MADKAWHRRSPEVGAGGYAQGDGTVEFYVRINSLLSAQSSVLDFGAGRGAWYDSDPSDGRRTLRHIDARVSRLVACDTDPAVLENRSARERVVLERPKLPFGDGEFDLIVADFVFEHLDDPGLVASELSRVLKPGGWICARTPNRNSYVGLITRATPNRLHQRVLASAQPDRESEDVFPTRFRLNSMRQISEVFPPDRFCNHSYFYQPAPGYDFGSRLVGLVMRTVDRVLPRQFSSNLFIFLHKRS